MSNGSAKGEDARSSDAPTVAAAAGSALGMSKCVGDADCRPVSTASTASLVCDVVSAGARAAPVKSLNSIDDLVSAAAGNLMTTAGNESGTVATSNHQIQASSGKRERSLSGLDILTSVVADRQTADLEATTSQPPVQTLPQSTAAAPRPPRPTLPSIRSGVLLARVSSLPLPSMQQQQQQHQQHQQPLKRPILPMSERSKSIAGSLSFAASSAMPPPSMLSQHQAPRLPSILTNQLSFASQSASSPSSTMSRSSPSSSSPPQHSQRFHQHYPSPQSHYKAPAASSYYHHLKSPAAHLASPPLSNASPVSTYSTSGGIPSASPTTAHMRTPYPQTPVAASPPVQTQTISGPGKKDRTCASCFAEYSSGNWYRDKERPGSYMCKSCYVCLNRKKRKHSISGSSSPYSPPAIPSATPEQQQQQQQQQQLPASPTSPRVAMLQVRQRRKPLTRTTPSDLLTRSCSGCGCTHSSGDWYRDKRGANLFNCQKCYQRLNREKVKKRTEEWLAAEFLKRSQSAAASAGAVVEDVVMENMETETPVAAV